MDDEASLTVNVFCIKLTSIQQADVGGSLTYKEVATSYERSLHVSQMQPGCHDARQLERDAGFAACPSLLSGLQHFNVRKWHKGLYDNQPKGLKQTVGAMGLACHGTYHRGIDDARNVASIVKEMLS